MRVLIVSMVATALSLSACASPERESAPPLANTSWIATEIGGVPVSPPGRVTLNIQTGQIGGNGSCNSYGGDVVVDGASIKIGPVISTQMACLENNLMAQENRYFQLLQRASRIERIGLGQLVITTSDGQKIIFRLSPIAARLSN